MNTAAKKIRFYRGLDNHCLAVAAPQELAGWETERVVRRYAHVSGEHLAPHAERMAEHLGTFWAQPVDDNQKPRKKKAAT